MSVTKVILIGENHYDLQKSARYERVLHQYQPDTFSLESDARGIKEVLETLQGVLHIADASRLRVGFGPLPRSNRKAMESLIGSYFYAAEKWRQATGRRVIFSDSLQMDILKEKEAQKTPFSLEGWEEMCRQDDFIVKCYTRGLGEKRIRSQFRKVRMLEDVIDYAVTDLLENGTPPQLQAFQRYADAMYLADIPLPTEVRVAERFEERDQATADYILHRGKGVVVHAGGFIHMFNNYDNLYQRLSRYVPVERRLLLEFSHDDPEEAKKYKEEISLLVEKMKSESPTPSS